MEQCRGSMDISGPDRWVRLMDTGTGCREVLGLLWLPQPTMEPGQPGLWLLTWVLVNIEGMLLWGFWRGVKVLQLWPGVQLPPKGGSLLAMLSAASPSIVYFFYS